MPIRFAIQNGNWSNASTWSGSLIPTASDDVFSNNFTVNVDTSFQVLSLNNTSGTGITAGGSFNFNSGSISGSVTSYGITGTLLNISAPSGTVELISPTYAFSLSGNAITNTGNCDFILRCNSLVTNGTNVVGFTKSGTGTLTFYGNLLSGGNSSAGTTTVNLSMTNGNLIVYGNVTATTGRGGGASILCSNPNSNLTIYGNVTGVFAGLFSNPAINWTAATGTIIISGSITGEVGHGLTTNSTCIISGSLIGGSTAGFAAVNTSNNLFLTGNVIGGPAGNGLITSGPVNIINGTVTGGTAAAISSTTANQINVSGSVVASANANAITSTNASGIVILNGNITNNAGRQAIYCQNLFLSDTGTTQAQFFTSGSQDRTLYSANTFPNLPSSSIVRSTTLYGPGNELSGSLIMPDPANVRYGVPTDNTTGSALLSAETLFDEIAISDNPVAVRLRKSSTTDTFGNMLTAFKK
jgi:hypothetical protein